MKHSVRIIRAAIGLAGLAVFTVLAGKHTEAQLHAEAKITKAAAEQTALAKLPNGTVKSSELEKEHGKLVWSFDIAVPNSKNITEVQVDAKTGKIAAVEIETPHHEAKEAAEDKPKR
jgi:hypothetical protein